MPKPGMREWLACGPVILGGSLLRYDGPFQTVSRFEEEFAGFIGCRHALTLTSGTVALHAAVTALGIGPGDEVLVPAYTWIATAAAPALAGAIPVLVDINETLTIDPADLERKITPATRAIMPVHMVNAPCDMDAIMAIARKHKLAVIEDACQAVGVRYKDRLCGSIGDIGVFSFNQHKNMSIGEGGAIVTNDSRLHARLMNFHDLGIWCRQGYEANGEPPFIASHARVTELQGAMLRVQLARLPGYVRRLERRVRMASGMLARSSVRLSPHNDRDRAATLTAVFDSEAEAIAYAERPGVSRLYDNSKHVYTNWDPILKKRMAHPALDPWAWATRDVSYDRTTCARTLDILKRTCRFHISPRWPMPALWYRARGWTGPVAGTPSRLGVEHVGAR